MEMNETNVFLNALKNHASECGTYKDETKEKLMIRLFESFEDDVDGFYYIRKMDLLSKAVSFYMMFSDDHVNTKKNVQEVFEQVIKNDYAYKEIADNLFLFRAALGDVYEKLKGNDKTY